MDWLESARFIGMLSANYAQSTWRFFSGDSAKKCVLLKVAVCG